MNYKNPVDFETYFFTEFLQKIRMGGNDRFSGELRDQLNAFIEFLLTDQEPLSSVEKLAKISGTSDLAIFFADLLERLPEKDPEKSLQDLDQYVQDFLEMFQELAGEDEWKTGVMPEITGGLTTEKQALLFIDFVTAEMRNALQKAFADGDNSLKEAVAELVNRIQGSAAIQEVINGYDPVPSLAPVVDSLRKIFYLPKKEAQLEAYLSEFAANLRELAENASQAAREHRDDFINFCQGKPVEQPAPETPGLEPEEELEEMIESARQMEERKPEKPSMSEEDRQLRLMLRDYIIHEIDELTLELKKAIEVYNLNPADPDSQSGITNVLKVFKDLGQIHKYPGIEKAAEELQASVNSLMRQQQPFSLPAIEAFEGLGGAFVTYINQVLDEHEENGLSNLEKGIETLRSKLTIAEKPGIPLTDTARLQPLFADVNARFLNRFRQQMNEWAAHPENEQRLAEIQHMAGHLLNWYQIWRLEVPADMMRFLREAAENGQVPKAPEIVEEAIALLKNRLFSVSEDEWKVLRDRFQEALAIGEMVSVSDSLEAFQDVTVRELRQLSEKLRSGGAPAPDVLWEEFQAVLEQIAGNSLLVGNDQLQLLVTDFLTRADDLRESDEAQQSRVLAEMPRILDMLIEAVERLPEPLPVDELIGELEGLMQVIPEEKIAPETPAETEPSGGEEAAQEEIAAEETAEEAAPGAEEAGQPVPAREQFIDEELTNVFKSEARKYLAEITDKLNGIAEYPNNRESLSRLGNLVHTLKGSAQMLNQLVIAEVARPAEHLVDLILEDQLPLTDRFIPLFRELVAGLERWLDGDEIDVAAMQGAINDYIEQKGAVEEASEVPEEIEEEAPAPDLIEKVAEEEGPEESEMLETVTEEEGDFLKLSEEDPELLEIFRSEVKNNIDIFDKNLALIEKFYHDKQTLHAIDQAVHEIRAAAKMLGFAEVGRLMDLMEQVVDAITKVEPENWDEVIPALRKGVMIVRKLSDNMEIERRIYDEAIENLITLVQEFQERAVGKKEKPAPAEEPEEPAAIAEEKAPREAPAPSPQVIEAFIQETREYLEDINFLLMKIEKDPENDELIYHLMRSLHTLKGSAAMVDMTRVEALTHLSEDIIEKYREKGEPLPQQAVDLMFEVVDEVEFMVDALSSGTPDKMRNYEELLNRLKTFYEEEFQVPAEVAEPPAPPAEPAAEEKKDEEFFKVAEESEQAAPVQREAYVRLHVNQMDRLLNEAAELVINHTQFKTQLDRFKNYLPRLDMEGKNVQNILWYLENARKEEERLRELLESGGTDPQAAEDLHKQQLDSLNRAMHTLKVFYNNFIQTLQGIKESASTYQEQIQKISRLSNSIHEEILEARLVPIAILFQRFHRPLRDLARKHQKKVRLIMEGESTELDRVLVEELYEPLLHILRNAVDHGIESPAERKQAGKPEEGTIRLSATHDRNFVTVEVADDGAGIDLEDIRRQAVELGYLQPDQGKELSTQELFEFLMYPGFSTRREVTTTSGRGVGLDVVRNQVQKIKGDLRIYSEKGKGTRFIIRVPISLTVTQAMLIEVAGHIYAIPLLQAEETLNITVRDLELKDGAYFMRHRGGHIPVLNLANLLKIKDGKRRPLSVVGEYPAIIVQDESQKVALLVDKIVHREEILIKTLGPNLQRVPFITGGSVLADGKVVLVLDIPQIVREAVRMKEADAILNPQDLVKPEDAGGDAERATGVKKRVSIVRGRKPVALVVDDSMSIRKFLAGLLMQQGYEVEMAKNGYNALEKLNQRDFDLLITDLEMPHLSGYELIEQVRQEEQWQKLPIVVLTGRASKHIEQLTKNLGADEFVVKPFKEDELLKMLDLYVIREE